MLTTNESNRSGLKKPYKCSFIQAYSALILLRSASAKFAVHCDGITALQRASMLGRSVYLRTITKNARVPSIRGDAVLLNVTNSAIRTVTNRAQQGKFSDHVRACKQLTRFFEHKVYANATDGTLPENTFSF
jgi:hypothetical protein